MPAGTPAHGCYCRAMPNRRLAGCRRPAGRLPALLSLFLALLPGEPMADPLDPADPIANGPLREQLADGGRARVVEVVDGDTLVLSDGAEVRLVGIQAPKLPLGRDGFAIWPLAPEAKAALEALALRQEVELAFGGRRSDRHGRLLAHLFRADGLWLQGAMVEAGLARVYGFEDNRALLAELYALERSARTARRGLWADPFYAILSTAQLERRLAELVDSFQLVEGRVQSSAIVRGRGYLNFGGDWRRDVTASIPGDSLALFRDAGIELADYEGHLVRVRGWVEDYNGPMIAVTHPEQIEVLE